MHAQKSFSGQSTTGILYLVATPIGNLEDMTVRAIRMMKEADYIAAEDTRNTKKLCNYFEIDTPLISYHEHNLEYGGEKLLELLRNGKNIALVSDAGLPCISDPGADIVAKAVAENLSVVPIPGANAALSALISSGLSTLSFTFYGFLPRQKKDRKAALEAIQYHKETMLFYEAPHRLKETLRDAQQILGSARKVVLAREVTKKFEEFVRGTLEEAVAWAEKEEVRGEFVMVIEGSTEENPDENEKWWINLSITEHVNHVIENQSLSSKEAIKVVAKDRDLPKRDVYQQYHIEE
ncbi:16S rRNA (cytidine(1402)-2'-O)-methyltransferase [Paenisporosarcina quisquiliarum]|uniref:Ribosomal RNA small subunit methyltransferase I n=1 Tax=Paenisporosarcina quisquiliarum TaxID=365346 RepID=A0A9X3RE46_9BACL|nr:16S rRNA (cytidine(1402)-2'-O)-methyltransferase [Paenisporosarcina quisquiliarum]MCZ8538485.1 16S rRNA (cytidine(1402)-2'-O)-methyltransferase [Paenisporosarcina quisquiliarum]